MLREAIIALENKSNHAGMGEHCVIIGGGHAAGEATAALRKEGFRGDGTLISGGPYLPYHRPPLSKTFLAEHLAPDALLIRPAESYASLGIRASLGRRAVEIDREHRFVTLEDGEELAYTA